MEFSRQEYWSRASFPTPGDLLDPGVEPTSPAQAGGFFITSATCEVEIVATLISLGSKITADSDGDRSHKIKRHFLLERKAMTNYNSVLKIRGITLPAKSIKSKLWFFQQLCINVRVGPQRSLSARELMF